MEYTAWWHQSRHDLHGASAMDKIIGIFKCETMFGAGIRVASF